MPGLDQRLVDAAIALLNARFPGTDGVAAAIYCDDGSILTGVSFEPEYGSVGLCAEVGPICEANTLGKRIVASVCVARDTPTSPIVILSPCGVCQERLMYWGQDIEVAVPEPNDPTRWLPVRLADVQPYYWAKVFGYRV